MVICPYCGEKFKTENFMSDKTKLNIHINLVHSSYWQCPDCKQTHDSSVKRCGFCGYSNVYKNKED